MRTSWTCRYPQAHIALASAVGGTPRQARNAQGGRKHVKRRKLDPQGCKVTANPPVNPPRLEQSQLAAPQPQVDCQPSDDHNSQRFCLSCQHFQQCSGCTLQEALHLPPLLSQAQRYFAQRGVSDFQLHVGPIHGWRTRARLAVRGTVQAPKVGLFRSRTHLVEDIPNCRIHHARINEAAALVRQAMQACGVQPYDEDTGQGDLRYLQLTVSRPDEGLQAAVQVVLVWNSSQGQQPRLAALHRLADMLWLLGCPAGRPPLVHSVWANFQPLATNTILGRGWSLLHGPQHLWQRLGGADICLAPGSFAQANTGAMDACLRAIQRHVPIGAAVADLHAGVGTIGLSLASTRMCSLVRCVEINPEGQAPFQQSAARLPPGTRMEYHVAAAGERPLDWLSGMDVVVVDPPRKGLEPALLDALCMGRSPLVPDNARSNSSCTGPEAALAKADSLLAMSAGRSDRGGCETRPMQTLVYLSCGFAALTCDCDALLASGRWRLQSAEAFLFFPGADHLETLAIFQRVDETGAG